MNEEGNHSAAASEGESVPDDGSQSDVSEFEDDHFEPDYTNANKIRFSMLCQKFETLWEQKSRRKGRRSKEELLGVLLPKKLKEYIGEGSPFPLLRLIAPDIDTSRPHTGMKEKTIATAYAFALGLGKQSSVREKLEKFTDPVVAGPTAAGDLSMAVKEVLEERFPPTKSKITVGELNKLLDQLASIKNAQTSTHDWRRQPAGRSSSGPTKATQRATWVQDLIHKYKLSPLEHKWVVRILLQKLDIGANYNSILKYYSPYALDLYSTNNSLKRLCNTLCNPNWVRRRTELAKREEEVLALDKRNYLPRSQASVSLGNTIAPMLSHKTRFANTLADMSSKHRNHAKTLSKDEFGAQSLALKFPPFICEVKLDGERIIAHIRRGIVTLQTRNSTWYSEIYSPVIGPALRRAVSSYDVDVILDGEIVAWDNARQENIPFGANRTVANARRLWVERHGGGIDERDRNLHEGQTDLNVMKIDNWRDRKVSHSSNGETEEGEECWLKYIVFDVLYVGGPDASKVLGEAVPSDEPIPTGSILSLSLLQRNKILYRLLSPQKSEVEFVPALVVRPNGRSLNAEDYFSASNPSMDSEHLSSDLDSTENALLGLVPDIQKIEARLRGNLSDLDISRRRADAVDQFYTEIVERRRLEGLLFKDLATPYVLGDQSRSLGYWRKIKPDYEDNGFASDIDTVVIGAYYATGLGASGLLNAFLLGCVDPDNPGHYMTLGKVSGGGTKRHTLESMLDYTGFKKWTEATGEVDYGKWFKETQHGKSVPDFISKRSCQHGSKGKGWSFAPKDYPDLWIHPEDSIVLTIKAGEIVPSDSFSAGVTLRFPRIEKVRIESADGGPKPPQEVESVDMLHELFREQSERREGSGSLEIQGGSLSKGMKPSSNRRFLTVEEHEKAKKAKRSKASQAAKSSMPGMPSVDKIESAALKGLKFVILEGTYHFDASSLDAEEAKEQGWFDEAAQISSQQEVIRFVLKHSGECKLTSSIDPSEMLVGGHPDDARVARHRKAWERASSEVASRSKQGKQIQEMRQLPGILKWTYLFSSVHRWISKVKIIKFEEGETPPSLMSRESDSDRFRLLRPRRHDYLLLNPCAEAIDDADIFGIDVRKDVTLTDLKRALEEVRHDQRRQETKKRANASDQRMRASHVPWQYATHAGLGTDEQWVMEGSLQKLWLEHLSIVLYPDFFLDDFGFQEEKEVTDEILSRTESPRWSQVLDAAKFGGVASVLPLATQMGARITPHLHRGVTHILCELRKGTSMLQWNPGHWDASKFMDQSRAMLLHQRLLAMHQCHSMEPNILIVSPEWIRTTWSK